MARQLFEEGQVSGRRELANFLTRSNLVVEAGDSLNRGSFMRSAYRVSGDGFSALLAFGLLLAWAPAAWSQSITATVPVAGNAVAVNKATHKIYVAGTGPTY